jgi:uncharacterized membrane protein YccC
MKMMVDLRELAMRMQWRRGLRAAIAVAGAMLVCEAFGRPFGWAALGAFEAILVDNGGPYRSRLNTILTVLAGGAFAGILGSLVGMLLHTGASLLEVALAALATGVACFAITFARVATQPLASTSVIILVLYFAGLGSSQTTLAGGAVNAALFVAGGMGAAAISLVLWPLDPFRPARRSVAHTYALLAAATGKIAAVQATGERGPLEEHDWKRQIRMHLEEARIALGKTAARAPARTHRARNLTVLLETADMLFARAMRLNELAEIADEAGRARLYATTAWLSEAENAIAHALEQKPADSGSSFSRHGSHRVQFLMRRAIPDATEGHDVPAHLADEERDARQELEIAFEAIRAIWSGVDRTGAARKEARIEAIPAAAEDSIVERIRADFSFGSIMLRHALRMGIVGVVDVALLHELHLAHGFWLAMTSIIVLQPSGSGTMRRGLQRVGGTIAGGMLAALLAALVHNRAGIIVVITVCAGLTLASFAVDYGIYAFFLTPTFVLMSLPYLRDWRYASVRVITTILGALVAVLAMRFLWPEQEEHELSNLLHAGALADAAYLRAVLRFWKTPAKDSRARLELERRMLAPARRACGLASNAAEETLDRLLLEPSFSRRAGSSTEHALAFTTYLRRLAQTVTTLAALVHPDDESCCDEARVEALAARLEALPGDARRSLEAVPSFEPTNVQDVVELQMKRMERQVLVLERAATAMTGRDTTIAR